LSAFSRGASPRSRHVVSQPVEVGDAAPDLGRTPRVDVFQQDGDAAGAVFTTTFSRSTGS